MAEIKFCKGGGQMGLSMTMVELATFNKKIGSKHNDEVVPLPDKTPEEQAVLLKTCDRHGDETPFRIGDVAYWETTTGQHGWYCTCCGSVRQWG